MTERVVEYRWVVPESARLDAVREIEASGATVESSGDPFDPAGNDYLDSSQSYFEPLVVIVSLMATVRLLSHLEKLWRDVRSEGGWLVDLRGGKVERHVLPNMPREELVIVTEQGARRALEWTALVRGASSQRPARWWRARRRLVREPVLLHGRWRGRCL